MMRFKPSLLTLALVAAGASMHSYAADAVTDKDVKAKKDAEIEVIQVKGFRTSVIKSLNDKTFWRYRR